MKFVQMFKRERQPGDIVFAWLMVALSLFLLVLMPEQTKWFSKLAFEKQPALWARIAVWLMVVSSILHLLSSLASPRIPGRWQETLLWCRSLEFVVWFLGYVYAAPWLGYLPSTLLFCLLLAWRMGYRQFKPLLQIALIAILIVVTFRAVLQVKVPSGALYDYLPDTMRSFFLQYL